MAIEAPAALYLHIPFCAQRCPYCDFAIRVGGDHLQETYIEALLAEVELLAACGPARPRLESVYLGGGTPSRLRLPLLERLLEKVRSRFDLAPELELTLEANPADVNPASAAAWHRLGVNRVSLGVQSLDDPTLRWLGRNHTAQQAERALADLRSAGFDNLSCDLLYAVPVQATQRFVQGLERLLEHRPEHLSCYELTVEEGTPLHRWVARRKVRAPSERDFLEQHRLARTRLLAAGFEHYEVSNYARPGRRSRHNLAYWGGRGYLGAGAGAHGFVPAEQARPLGLEPGPEAVGVRYWNRRGTSQYLRQVAQLGHGRAGWEELGEGELRLERLSCGLRLEAGVRLEEAQLAPRARELAAQGLLEISADRVRATPRGVEVLDRVTLELLA
ncbi:MAG: radical SAM family heme chaperone HemW [Candidatus Dormibacteria bacterium]